MAEQLRGSPADKDILPALISTPTDGARADDIQGAWLFSPPSLANRTPPRKSTMKSSTGRRSSFFFFASTPKTHTKNDQPVRLQRLQQIPEETLKRRKRRTPLILLGSVLLFGIIAAVLLLSSRTKANDNSAMSSGGVTEPTTGILTTNAPPPPEETISVATTTNTPIESNAEMLEQTPAPKDLDEDQHASGPGDGSNVLWKKYRFYFVNKCPSPLNIYQKYRDDSAHWSFCPLPPLSYGCANNRDGAYLHTPSGGFDQATLFEITVKSTSGTHYDISIIPPGCDKGRSLAECKQITGKVGFNLPMQVIPMNSICPTLTCLADGCADAYQYPKDDTKNTGCVDPDAIFQVTFCPSASVGPRFRR